MFKENKSETATATPAAATYRISSGRNTDAVGLRSAEETGDTKGNLWD